MGKLETLLMRGLEFALSILLLAIAVVVVAMVVLRYVFNSSITGANEFVTILFVYSTAIGAALAVGKGEHIAIGFAVERLSARNRRRAEIAGLIAMAVLNAMIVCYSIYWIRITGDYLMPSTGLPRAVAQLSIPFGSTLAFVFCVLRVISPARDVSSVDEHDTSSSFDRSLE